MRVCQLENEPPMQYKCIFCIHQERMYGCSIIGEDIRGVHGSSGNPPSDILGFPSYDFGTTWEAILEPFLQQNMRPLLAKAIISFQYLFGYGSILTYLQMIPSLSISARLNSSRHISSLSMMITQLSPSWSNQVITHFDHWSSKDQLFFLTFSLVCFHSKSHLNITWIIYDNWYVSVYSNWSVKISCFFIP